jgi:DNA-binding cell septation regulator SpoVG
MVKMKITQMSNVSWTQSPKVKATCTIDVNGFCIKECKVIDGINGIFVVSPSKKLTTPYENKKTGEMVNYEDIVWFPQDKRDTLNDLVANHYDPNQQDYKPYDANGNPVSFNNNNKNVSKTADVDIPF